jgi:hypothetical protein
MADFLTEEWLAAQPMVAVPGLSAVVQHVVTAAPEGNVVYSVTYADGEPAAALGQVDAADVTLTLSYDDARRIADGENSLAAAYMQGRLRAEGDMKAIFALLEAAPRPSATA